MAVRPLKANRWFDEDAKDVITPRRDLVEGLERQIDEAIESGAFERREADNRKRLSIVNLNRPPEMLKRLLDEGGVLPELRRRYIAVGYDDFSIDWERGVAILKHSAY